MPNELDADDLIEDLLVAYNGYLDEGGNDELGEQTAAYYALRRRITALLTAAVPERHDAPGVSLAQVDDLIAATEQAYAGYADVNHPYANGRLAALHEVRFLLTGQPDAGAGGES